MFIVFASYRKGEKWAWTALLIGNILGGGNVLVSGAIFSDPVGITIGIVYVCLSLIGLLIPVKVFFAKEAEAV